ncbi:DUF2158 domain-containing protein [Erwinia rhapontici]|uniref:YodC family protein n=1 Tax=Erwinia rhapontici TaxID=55212 RepID=UPI003D36E39A
MAQSFENGQVVQLKSGGPLMTVVEYNEEYETYHCQWFEKSKLEQANFTQPVLTAYEE